MDQEKRRMDSESEIGNHILGSSKYASIIDPVISAYFEWACSRLSDYGLDIVAYGDKTIYTVFSEDKCPCLVVDVCELGKCEPILKFEFQAEEPIDSLMKRFWDSWQHLRKESMVAGNGAVITHPGCKSMNQSRDFSSALNETLSLLNQEGRGLLFPEEPTPTEASMRRRKSVLAAMLPDRLRSLFGENANLYSSPQGLALGCPHCGEKIPVLPEGQ